ncbi:MAG: hypothetical protein BZY83_00905 [SAR202 cluster bacterium Casp-Chloro-G2]|nr:MAG: hypothetical protein BZY83_00905 [SAR202 cluster bacterium Casp-Chloro-G2]
MSGGDDFLSRLPREVSRWENDGLISADQGQSILGRYPQESTAPGSRAQSRLITGLSVIGAVLVGLGIILFFAANWDGMARSAKMAIIIAAVLSGHGLGYYLRYHRGYLRVGSAMVLLACLIYGAGVHLVGQAYNVEVNDPRLMLFWFLGVFPLVYIVRSQPIQFLGLALFLAAVGFRMPDWVDEVSRGQAVLGLSLFLVLGLLIFAVGRIKEEFNLLRPYSESFQLVGLITALAAVFVLTFKEVFDSFDDGLYIQGETELAFRAMIVSAGALTVLLVLAAAWLQRRNGLEFALNATEGLAIGILLASAYVVASVTSGGDVFYAVVFNVLLALTLLGVLVSGYLRGREALVNIALAFIGIDIVARYFEYSWNLLDRSLIFVAAGVILLLGGYLAERGRQKMLERIRASGGSFGSDEGSVGFWGGPGGSSRGQR